MSKQGSKGKPLTEEEMAKYNLKKLPDGTVEGTFKMEFTIKDAVLFYLSMWRNHENLPDATRSRISDTFNYLQEHLVDLKINPKTKQVTYTAKTSADRAVMDRHIQADYFQGAIGIIYRENVKEEPKINGKFKRSGHLTDQMLKYSYPKDNTPQLSIIFDSLQEGTQKEIVGAGVEITQVAEGIKLSPAETKIIDCLCKLLHESSQTLTPDETDYYTGNKGYDLVEYGGDKTPAPKLAFTLYELTKEYKGDEAVSGKDVENVKQILTELDNKRFLLSYVETTKKKDGGRIERKIEDFRKLIHILKISQTEYSKEDIELSKKEETIILLNPIFRRQINSKFILYPNDINRRTIIAYGSHNLSEITLRLRDYLIRELSSKRYTPEITLDKLYYFLAEKWMKESRRKKVKDYTNKALETVKALGLLKGYEIKPGATGEPKIIFSLNKGWE